jgi:predicted lipid-binding transport protein (Tim44 family)
LIPSSNMLITLASPFQGKLPPTASPSSGSFPIGELIGAIVGAVVLVLILIVVALTIVTARRRRQRRRRNQRNRTHQQATRQQETPAMNAREMREIDQKPPPSYAAADKVTDTKSVEQPQQFPPIQISRATTSK